MDVFFCATDARKSYKAKIQENTICPSTTIERVIASSVQLVAEKVINLNKIKKAHNTNQSIMY